MNYNDYLESKADVMLGKPVIRGTRITVELILKMLSEGATSSDILAAYPDLQEIHIKAVLAYASNAVAGEPFSKKTQQMPHPLTTIADKWFHAFNTHDLEALLALYANDARHYSPKLKIRQPETNGYVTGKAALRAWWQDSFDRLPTLQYRPTRYTANDERIFMEYTRTVAGEPDMLVAELLEVKDGLIVASQVYHG